MTDSQRWFVAFILLGVLGLVYVLSPVLLPFLIATFIAYLFNPWVEKLIYCRLPRILAVSLVFLVILLLLFFFIFLIIPLLEKQLILLIQQIPEINLWLSQVVWPWMNKYIHLQDQFDLNQIKSVLLEHWSTGSTVLSKIWMMASRSGGAVIQWVSNLVLVPVLSFYLLCDWPNIIHQIKLLMPRQSEKKIVELAKECGEVLAAFFRGQLLVMFCLGLIYGFGLWMIGLKVGLLIGLLSGLLNIVPYLGFISGLFSASIASLIQFHSWMHIGLVLMIFIIGSLSESFLLTPWFVGDRVGLHPLLIIFSILAFSQLLGFVGILIAVPVFAVLMVFLRHFRGRYLNSGYYNHKVFDDD